MAKFEPAINFTEKWEGGFNDNPADHGGHTVFGISFRFLAALAKRDAAGATDADIDGSGTVTPEDIEALAKDKPRALAIFKKYFWEPYNFDKLDCQPVATKIFDMVVNMRPSTAFHLVQESCNALGAGLTIDNCYGPKTMAAVNELSAADPGRFLNTLRTFHLQFYRNRVLNDPSQGVFWNGWEARAKG